MKLFLDKYGLPRSGQKVLHLAPEQSLLRVLLDKGQLEYIAADLMPENFPYFAVQRMDLCSEVQSLPQGHFDVIIHSHVMEHLPCNITSVLINLHRALHENGIHFMCIPFSRGWSEEDFSPILPEEALRRFGQGDHVRRFGREDYQKTIGMVFDIAENYSLYNYFDVDDLDSSNIPEGLRVGLTGASVFPFHKNDCYFR